MTRNTKAVGFFLYHSIGQYPGKEEDLAQAMVEFSAVWAAADDKQWGWWCQTNSNQSQLGQ